MRISHHPNGHYLYRNDDIVVPFDAVVSTGKGYWSLRRDGHETARVLDLSPLSQADNELFHEIGMSTDTVGETLMVKADH